MPFGKSKALLAGLGVAVVLVLLAGFMVLRAEDNECVPSVAHPEWSVARHWNEAALNAVRRDLPAPTVHSRNLFHASAAMWDAWAAFDPSARGVFVDEQHSASDLAATRNEAVSYAAYRVLEHRYIEAAGGSDSIPEFDELMASLCYPIDLRTIEGDSPAAVGNRIAASIIETALQDGSNEAGGYEAEYEAVNVPLVVKDPGTEMADPNRWQPLEIENMISQNGILVENGSQEFIDPHWGFVTSFALGDPGSDGVPLDPGAPPLLGDPATDAEFKDAAVEVIRYSSLLDPTGGETIDISPASLGANSLGTNDGSGYSSNPVTGAPYQQNLVDHADFGRAVAEFWADGPNSETPPGHWNTLANTVSDALGDELRIGGVGPPVDWLEWDVKLYLALNAANHAAIAAS